jgi:dTMP kinase
MQRPKSGSHKNFETTGKLVVVEGIDGSGKSTQLHLIDRWLRSLGLPVFNTEWNSSQIVKDITSKGKKKGLLTPTTFSLLHATDFADRYERNILPLLRAGYFVLSDRYVYTAYARDVVRGCSPGWIRKVYSFAAKPDLPFYFRVPIEVGMKRILVSRPKLKFYEAGMDLNLSNDVYESYRMFQSQIIEQYELMAEQEEFIIVDGSLDIEEQQEIVRQKVSQILPSSRVKQLAQPMIRT